MPKLDLNNAGDFQRLTLGSAAGILQTLDLLGRDPAKWDIKEASFRGVLFHVFESKTDPVYDASLSSIQDSGGRRKVKYTYPYRDGQTTDDLGRKAFVFTADAVLFGPRYRVALGKLIQAFNDPTPADLIHPVLGTFRCVVEDYTLKHQHESRRAVELSITFAEHSYDIGQLREFEDKSTKGLLSRALDAIKFVDNVITNVLGVAIFARSLKLQIEQSLTDYQNKFNESLLAINVSFNKRGFFDLPNLLPVSQGGQQSEVFEVATSPNDRYKNVSLGQQLPAALAVDDVTKKVITTRQVLNEAIALIEGGADGQGALEFHEDIVELKNGAILLQKALEAGIASSRAQVVNYTTPREMSVREISFANGIDVERSIEIDLLNPELDSVNCVPRGTIVRVPIE